MSTNKHSGKFLEKWGRFERSKGMQVWFPLAVLNLMGIIFAFGLPYSVLDSNNMLSHTYKAELKPDGFYKISVSLNDTGTYVVKGDDIDLVGINCGASFSIQGVSSVPGTIEQQIGRCITGQTDHTVYVLETVVNEGIFRVVSLRDGWSVNAPAALKDIGPFEVDYIVPPWTFFVYLGLVVWALVVLVVCYLGNMIFWTLLDREHEHTSSRAS
jgi:hypothetical protein